LTQPKAGLLQRTLDMLILKALTLGPLHDYGIIQRIRLALAIAKVKKAV
jgi:hypothetical protein